MQKVFMRSQYNYDTDQVSQATGLECRDESLAQQHQRDDADINTIVRRFGVTGELPAANMQAPQYGDFTGITDYQSALNSVRAANASFMSMPAVVRSRFSNSPEEFVRFCSDSANAEELVKLGLAKPRIVTDPGKDDKKLQKDDKPADNAGAK